MNKELIVSSTRHATMAAILEDDQVMEVFIERELHRGAVGNIYKGRVSKVLPGMQCAFVDIGLERDAFLYVGDVIDPAETFDRLESDDGDDTDDGDGNAQTNGTEGSQASRGASSGGGGHRHRRKDETSDASGDGPRDGKIEELLTGGQELLVQVVKEPLGTKGARITSHATVPGRFLVFMPTVDHIGVSRKIDSRAERSRLRSIVKKFREEHGLTGGVILRTAAAGRPEEDIVGDLEYFHQLWTETREKMETRQAPAVVHREESLVAKLLRDFLTTDFSTIRIDDRREFERAVRLIERIMPDLVPRVRHYDKEFPILEEYGVQTEIDKALRSKVWLKSGGYIVINHTEALVAIDVNTGRYVGKRTGRLEDTIIKTNLEAVKEIVRQIRLRDLGGIIVLDFIDMEERKNRQKVAQMMDQELRRDRSPSKAVQVSEFGLIVVTRKRVKRSLERLLTEPCPYCAGSAVVKSRSTICSDILSEMQKIGDALDGRGVRLCVNPDIARALRGEERDVFAEIERFLGRSVTLTSDTQLHHEQFDVMAM